MTKVAIASRYCENKRYVILNEFVTHLRLNVDIAITNSEAVDLLLSLGYKRKRIAFDTYEGVTQSRNEFINELLPADGKPILGQMMTHDKVMMILSLKILHYFKDHFHEKDLANGLVNFNLFESPNDKGLILLFDNASLKEALRKIMPKFNYTEKSIVPIATFIRHMSEASYIRENTYTENARRAVDKKFYKYVFAGENNE